MNISQFETFCSSIGLSGPEAQTLKEELDKIELSSSPSSSSLSLACKAAQLCIGPDNPTSKADVAKAIKIIKYFNVKFALRSGGHSPNPGWSSTAGGILVDLQKLHQVTLSGDKKVASLGPGARWGDVIATLDTQGTSVIGGRIPAVGVGGLILGGGFWHFSGEFGMAADNVKNFEVVLANGTVVNANAGENSDLFWALKGGGPNFGVVTRFDLYTIPVREIWYQFAVYPVEQAFAIFDAFVQWQKEGASDLKSTVGLIISLDNIVVGLMYSAPADHPPAFAPFYSLEPPLMFAVPATNGTVGLLTRFLSNTFSKEPLRYLYKDVYTFWRERALQVRETTGAIQTFTIQPIPKNLAEQGIAKGGNPMGIPREDHQCLPTRERNLDLPFLFMNDASRDQNPLASYGPENVEKLRQISRKYDEDQLFQNQQNDGFLLSKV
ncbi:FAD-binding domain-containing protein [Whalleya microplaca]|nr:FAD-binding domain-containing protein [Whalleya microplaca]